MICLILNYFLALSRSKVISEINLIALGTYVGNISPLTNKTSEILIKSKDLSKLITVKSQQLITAVVRIKPTCYSMESVLSYIYDNFI
jgi:hypothetical protein